jgi:hypothetical protein
MLVKMEVADSAPLTFISVYKTLCQVIPPPMTPSEEL